MAIVMGYRLDPRTDFGSAARLAARGRLDKGAAVLREEREKDPAGAVHQARKEVKKARSLLARPALDKRVYRRENRTLRDAARTVADVRDADVTVETVDGPRERFAGQLPARSFNNLRRRLKRQADRARKQAGNELGAELSAALTVVAGRGRGLAASSASV